MFRSSYTLKYMRSLCTLNHLTQKSFFPSIFTPTNQQILSKSLNEMLLPSLIRKDIKNKIYLIDGTNNLTKTFHEVYDDSYKFAEALRQTYGIHKQDCIAIISPNHLHYITVLFGSSLNGAILTPINHLYTAPEIEYQLDITQAKVIVSHPQCLDRVASIASHRGIPLITLGETDGHATSIHDILTTVDGSVDPASFPSVSPEDTVIIPFSSGTTGKSKGVVLSHRNIMSNILQCQILDKHARDRTNTVAMVPLPFYHIYGLFVALFSPLYQHHTTVFMSSFDLPLFLSLIEKHRVTRAFIVPPILLALAKHPIVDKYDLKSLQVIACGAAPLGSDIQQLCAKRLNCVVKQGWGMTELSPVGTGILFEIYLTHRL